MAGGRGGGGEEGGWGVGVGMGGEWRAIGSSVLASPLIKADTPDGRVLFNTANEP